MSASRRWELLNVDGERVAGPVQATSQGGALALMRDELGRKRLPNGAWLQEIEESKLPVYEPPYTLSRQVQYDHTPESLDLMTGQAPVEDVRDACIKGEHYLVLDGRGRVVCGRPTIEEAKAAMRVYENE